MLAGSIVATILPIPKSRVRVICNTLLLAMSTENFFLSFGKSLPVWCVGAVLGWISIPVMNANMDVLFRNYIPLTMQEGCMRQGTRFSFFNSCGICSGRFLVDRVFELFMIGQPADSFWAEAFGRGKEPVRRCCFCAWSPRRGNVSCIQKGSSYLETGTKKRD